MTKVLIVAREKPRCSSTGVFLFRFDRVAYTLGWLPPIRFCPTICRYSGKLYQPKQKPKMTKIYSKWHTPFLLQYRGGSFCIIPQSFQVCLLSKRTLDCQFSCRSQNWSRVQSKNFSALRKIFKPLTKFARHDFL